MTLIVLYVFLIWTLLKKSKVFNVVIVHVHSDDQYQKLMFTTHSSELNKVSVTLKLKRTILLGAWGLFAVKILVNSTLSSSSVSSSWSSGLISCFGCNTNKYITLNITCFNLLHQCIQLFRDRLTEKVHATIPKGIVDGFEFDVPQRNLKELHQKPSTYVCAC